MEVTEFGGQQLVPDSSICGPCDCLCTNCNECYPHANDHNSFEQGDQAFL